MKTVNLIIFFMIISSFIVIAQEPERILLLDLTYDNKDISLLQQTKAFGYYPDHKVQPSHGYTLAIIRESGIYSFKFPDPSIVFTDKVSPTNQLSGGIVFLNQSQFTLVVPDFADAKKIVIVNDKNETIEEIESKEEKLSNKIMYNSIFGIIFIIIIIVFALYFRFKRNREQKM